METQSLKLRTPERKLYHLSFVQTGDCAVVVVGRHIQYIDGGTIYTLYSRRATPLAVAPLGPSYEVAASMTIFMIARYR